MLEPRTIVRIHRRMPDPTEAPPPESDALLWRSRERRGVGGVESLQRHVQQGPHGSLTFLRAVPIEAVRGVQP